MGPFGNTTFSPPVFGPVSNPVPPQGSPHVVFTLGFPVADHTRYYSF